MRSALKARLGVKEIAIPAPHKAIAICLNLSDIWILFHYSISPNFSNILYSMICFQAPQSMLLFIIAYLLDFLFNIMV